MAMITRCPECNTTFRVAPPQLQAQNGMVRCGRCMTVFDGFKTLSTAEGLAGAEAPRRQAAAVAEPVPADVPAEPAFQLEPVSATELAAAAAEPGRDLAVRSESADETKDFGPAPEQLTIEDHLFLEESRDAKARSARWWAIGAALLLLVLAAQGVYFYRGELAAHLPWSRLYLARMCDLLECGVFLPQRPRLIVIEASDLQATDPARPAVIQLTATIRNHAGYDVGYPALDLVLTNSREHTLARRIFLPGDYLEPGRDVRAGIPASAEVTIRLDLDTVDLNPAGFRLDLLAAPPS
jgi:predicted Zn finger-like uncharacterized protein